MDIALIDTSAWIDFFRGEPKAVRRVDVLLQSDSARLCGPVYAEILSGARNKAEQQELKLHLLAVPRIEIQEPAWERTADVRFALARMGRQSSLLDVMIAQTAVDWGARLLTRDQDFERMRGIVPFDLDLF